MAARARTHRFEQEVFLLDETEWARFVPLLDRIGRHMDHRARTKTLDIDDWRRTNAQILDLYEEITGTRLDAPGWIYSLRMADYGAPCPECGMLFRTPKGKLCPGCGEWLPDGRVAGPFEG